MPTLSQLAKSKTIEVNTWGGLILALLTAAGVSVPPLAIAIGIPLVNILLRFMTDKALSQK